MREIKFRAWDRVVGMCRIVGVDFETDTVTIMDRDTKHFFTLNIENANLMQYTGLKDKNGKDIYEGDILQWDYDTRWKQHLSGVMEVDIPGIYYALENESCHPFETEEECLIIGDIYENPELLKEGGDVEK